MAELFGWHMGDLDGKDVTILVPPPYNVIGYMSSFGGGKQSDVLLGGIKEKAEKATTKNSTISVEVRGQTQL